MTTPSVEGAGGLTGCCMVKVLGFQVGSWADPWFLGFIQLSNMVNKGNFFWRTGADEVMWKRIADRVEERTEE